MSEQHNRDRQRIWIMLCAFLSGFCIMTVELLGGKILAPYFGGSVYVWGSIITVFMLALSLGYLLGGKWSLRHPSINKYGLVFMASSLAVAPIALASDAISDWVFELIEDPRYGSLAASMCLFFVPTMVMGMIAPYSIRLLVSSTDSSGHTAGHLYFVSTLGSAIGTLATSFYLVLWFEINQIIWAVATSMLLAGLLSILLIRTTPRLSTCP